MAALCGFGLLHPNAMPPKAGEIVRAPAAPYPEIAESEHAYTISNGPAPIPVSPRHTAQSQHLLPAVRKPVAVRRQFLNTKSPARQVMFVPVSAETGAEVVRCKVYP